LIRDRHRGIVGMPMRNAALRAVAWLAVVAAAVVGLTTFGGWNAFLDVTGISQAANGDGIYRAMDTQCGQIGQAYPDDVVICQTQLEFERDLGMACADIGSLPADHFLVATGRQIAAMACE
jgi:hypothetical protein